MSNEINLPLKKSFDKCFGCGKDNPSGLKLNFSWDGTTARADFTPGDLHQGWPGIVHGGLVCCLLDEAMAYVAYFHGLKGLTARTQARLRTPLLIGEPLHIIGNATRKTRKLLEATASVIREDGSVGAEGQAVIFLADKQESTETTTGQDLCMTIHLDSAQDLAVLWDMDGIIVNTGPYHLQAWQKAFAMRSAKFTAGDFQHSFGQRNDNIIRSVLGKDVSAEQIKAIAEDKETFFRMNIATNIRPFPGAVELVSSLNYHGYKQAIASSAPIENIHLLLQSLNLLSCFQVIVSGRDVVKGKPDPQVFLTAARRLNVEQKNCLVIEDAVAGVQAAQAAGMKCLAVTNTHPKGNLDKANLVVDSLSEVSIGTIEKLLSTP